MFCFVEEVAVQNMGNMAWPLPNHASLGAYNEGTVPVKGKPYGVKSPY